MSRIEQAFQKKKAFIPFITCGDPSLEVTKKLVCAMEKAGADLIELGIPFSDPTAEGPVIQAANIRALSAGVTTDKIFKMVDEVRQESSVPLVFMTYANVVFSYGIERFVKKAVEVGMDGLILPDVPYEEKEEFQAVCQRYGLAFISLIAPTSQEGFYDCQGGGRVRLLRLFSGGDGRAFPDYDGRRSHGKAGKAVPGYPLRRRFWDFHTGAGQRDGPVRGWSHCGKRDCETVRGV